MPKRIRASSQREASTSHKRNTTQYEEGKASHSHKKNNTQREEDNSLFTESKDDFVHRFVRFMMIRGSSNSIITDSDIKRNVLNTKGAPKLKEILQPAKRRLEQIYGVRLQRSLNTKTQYYFLQSVIEEIALDEEYEFSVPDDTHRILLMLVLTHIFMTENNCSEESLLKFMEKFQSVGLGNSSDFLKNAIKQKYLNSTNENNKVKYSWGPKAECTVSKSNILKFMSELYEKPVRKWPKGLLAAEEQEKCLDEDYNMEFSDESDVN